MNAMGVLGFMIGLVFMALTLVFTPGENETRKAEAWTRGFAIYRKAVNDYALEHKSLGVALNSINASALNLPNGLVLKNWQNRVAASGADIICYVYGPASPNEYEAARTFFKGSAAIGWKQNGVMLRNGPALALPGFIPDGSLVSVIKLN